MKINWIDNFGIKMIAVGEYKPVTSKQIKAKAQAMNQKRDKNGRFTRKYGIKDIAQEFVATNYITDEEKSLWTREGTEEWFESLWDTNRVTYMKCLEALQKIRMETW